MTPTTNISIRMDVDLKKQADKLFHELGMNMTTAFQIFLRQAVRQQRIPFEIALETPNAETIAAMREAERTSQDSSVKGYTNVKKMMKDLQSGVRDKTDQPVQARLEKHFAPEL